MRIRARHEMLGMLALAVVVGGAWVFAQASPPPPAAGAPGQTQPGRAGGRGNEPDFTKKPPIQPLPPAESATRFWLQPGFEMTPVLSEPDIQEPAQIAFDGNGRMYVVELRGYMQDADGTGELAPVGRISVHDDRNNDGVYETHRVFVDKLVFPRFVTPFGANAILTKESNADEVWKFTDTNGDLVADKKELFATGLGRLLNVEHQESGFIWALDNWIYSTINPVRIRWTPNGVLREPTGTNQSQWGVTQDNDGKPWFQNGGSGMPGYFQFPVVYGNFNYPEQFEADLNITWGAPVLVADMQGGMNAVRMPDGSLNRATGAAGNDIFRGDRLPPDLVGDYFSGEVVGRIVRRMRPVKDEGLTQLRNVHPLQEFIRSTDPLFRPTDMTTAPDGTMYITDMYRGVIQEYQWSGPGTYIRQRIEQYALDKVVRHGRIWRLSHTSVPRRTDRPRMLEETPAQLVGHLSDANGWWRDTAQQQLVLRQDKSVGPALLSLVRSSPSQLARIHALWTLEGLGLANAPMVRSLMADREEQLRIHAIRVSESLYKAGDRSFANDWKSLAGDPNGDVVIQALLTLNTLRVAGARDTAVAVQANARWKGVRLVANAIANPPPPPTRETAATAMESIASYSPAERAVIEDGGKAYGEICFSCHGSDGLGAPAEGNDGAARAPALAASPRVLGHKDFVINALLYGLTGRINGVEYSDVMIPMSQNTDQWIASVASYVRNAFGNRAPLVTSDDVAAVRRAGASRRVSWPVDELVRSLPRQLPPTPQWRFSASHNSAVAANAISIQPWSSGEPQKIGMWLQVELPETATLAEIQFESSVVHEANVGMVPGGPTVTTAAVAGGGRYGRGNAQNLSPDAAGFPRAFEVTVSLDGSTWTPVATHHGAGSATAVRFEAIRGRFLRMTLTGDGNGLPAWSVQRLRLYEPGSAPSR